MTKGIYVKKMINFLEKTQGMLDLQFENYFISFNQIFLF